MSSQWIPVCVWKDQKLADVLDGGKNDPDKDREECDEQALPDDTKSDAFFPPRHTVSNIPYVYLLYNLYLHVCLTHKLGGVISAREKRRLCCVKLSG